MKLLGARRLSSGLLWGALQGCANAALVGDNSAAIVDADVPDVPSIQGAIDDEAGPIRFEVQAERVVSPTWRYDFECGDEGCARGSDVRLAPDGSVWAVLQGGLLSVTPSMGRPVDSELVFVHLAATDGRVLGTYKRALVPGPTKAVTELGSRLLIDQQGRPYVIRWPGFANNPPLPPGHVFRVGNGELEEEPLPAGFSKRDTSFIAGFPDGTFMEFSNQKEARAVRFSMSGEVLWRTSDLRAVAEVNGSTYWTNGPTYLSDGSLVIDNLQKGGATGSFGRGLSVLGPDGALRWDMSYFLSEGSFKQLAAGLAGGLLLAGIRANDSDLEIFSYDRRGELLGSYRGARTGYHSVAPRALGVDESGALYVAVVVGDRKQPKLSVCKLQSVVQPSATCVALDLLPSDRSESAIVYPFMGIRMEIAARGVVLLALTHLVGEAVITSIARMDLDAPSATPAP